MISCEDFLLTAYPLPAVLYKSIPFFLDLYLVARDSNIVGLPTNSVPSSTDMTIRTESVDHVISDPFQVSLYIYLLCQLAYMLAT